MRDAYEDPASRQEMIEPTSQDANVVLDVLENLERTDEVDRVGWVVVLVP
jgi:hypothetical protein